MTTKSAPAQSIVVCLAILCGGFLNGCSRGARPAIVHPVAGMLTVNGSPAANLIIHFVPSTGRPSTGVTDARGVFEMRYEKDVVGAIPGEHKVWIEFRPASPTEEMAVRAGKIPVSSDVQAALQKFGSAASTPLTVKVDGPKKDLRIEM